MLQKSMLRQTILKLALWNKSVLCKHIVQCCGVVSNAHAHMYLSPAHPCGMSVQMPGKIQGESLGSLK